MATNLVRTVPASAVTLLTYEALDALLDPEKSFGGGAKA